MENIHTFRQINERLDVALSTLDASSMTPEQASELCEDLHILQQKLATVTSFVEARVSGDNVHAFRALTPVPTPAAEPMLDTDIEMATSVWPDGRQFEWVGGQCIVN